MNMRFIGLVIFLVLISGFCFGQDQASSDFNTYNLYGTWINKELYNSNKELKVYEKVYVNDKKIIGYIFKFELNGKLISKVHLNTRRKCASDIGYTPKTGNWNYDSQTNLLKIKLNNRNITTYQVLELTPDKLMLKKVLNK